MHDKILILDFGSQVTQLIARRVREAHVFCEIHPNDVSDAFIREFAPKGIILSGSHASTYEEHELRAPQAVFDLGVPVLGICYGMFTMAVQLGGQVEASTHREFGYAEVRARGHTRLLARPRGLLDDRRPRHAQGLDEPRRQGHRAAARLRADGLDAELPDRRHGRRGAAATTRVQFHPEVTHTVKGRELLERFVLEICGAPARLGDGQLHRRGGGAHPRPGRRRRGHPRPLRRRRFERRRGADPQGDRRPADLRLRRPRPAPPRRRPPGDGDVRRPAARQGDRRRRQRAVPRPARRRGRPRGQAQDHRPRVRRGLHPRGRQAQAGQVAGAGHDLSRRDRVAAAPSRRRRSRSRATTTSAACRRRSA